MAIKEVDLAEIEDVNRPKVLREISILRQLNHENIVKYIDCHEENNVLYVIMEFIETGTLLVSSSTHTPTISHSFLPFCTSRMP